jgi:hypothetical protein
MMNHPEIVRLVITYTLVGAFVFTAIATCLSLVGIIKFSQEDQQRKLFYVLIVELTVGCVGVFFDFISLNPTSVAKDIETRSIQQADLSVTRATTAALVDTVTRGSATTRQTVVINTNTSSAIQVLRVLIDGEALEITNATYRIEMTSGTHVLSWFVLGAPNSSYTVQITEPLAAAFRQASIIGADGKDAGAHPFRI